MPTLFDEIQIELPALGSLEDRVPPRPFQAEALAEFKAAYERSERGMLYRLATGLGKTYTASLTADEWLWADPQKRRAMVICYEREHVKQFRDEIEGFLPGVTVGLEMGTDGTVSPDRIPPIVVSSRQSLYVDGEGRSRLFKFNADLYDWLIVCEEAHGWAYRLKSCTHIFDWFGTNPNNVRVGLTATPQRGDGVSLGRLFGHVCVEMRLGRAIDEGYLVPFRQKFIQIDGIDFKNLNEVAGDFDEGELDEILSQREQLMAMTVPLLEHAGSRRTIVFCPGVACAKALARTINAEIATRNLPHGHAESMDGSTPDAIRDDTKARHKAGKFQFLVVCNLCRAGYDDPGISCVAVFRPTKSRVLAEQMKGRGVRPLRGLINGIATAEERRAAIAGSTKPDCLVIDLVGVSGMPEVATTAHLLAEGEPDEVIERANERMADNDESADEALRKAKAEIAEEREKAKAEREAQERREKEDAERHARLKAEVKYTARDVTGLDNGGSRVEVRSMQPPATEGQVRLIVANGWTEAAARRLTKAQASGVIGKLMSGRQSQPRPVHTDPAGPPTDRQLFVLKKHNRPTPRSFAEAADLIRDINRELSRR